MFQRQIARPVVALVARAGRPIGQILILAGAALAVFTVEGRLVSPPAIEPARSPTNQVRQPGFPSASDQRALAVALRSSRPEEPFNLGVANRLVYRGTVHIDDRRISIYENWLQWLLGHAHPPLQRVQDSERLAKGVGANCSERAQILKTLVERSGRQCRFIGLNGHVLLEVETEAGWCIADPDYGVVYPMHMERLAHAESRSFIWRRLAGQGYRPPVIGSYITMVQSVHDNVALPVGSPLSPRLYYVEVACQWLVWLIPASILLAGWALAEVKWGRSRRSTY